MILRYKTKQLKSFLSENGFKEITGCDKYYLELCDFFESEEISEYISHLMYLKSSNKVDLGKTPGSYNITNIYF